MSLCPVSPDCNQSPEQQQLAPRYQSPEQQQSHDQFPAWLQVNDSIFIPSDPYGDVSGGNGTVRTYVPETSLESGRHAKLACKMCNRESTLEDEKTVAARLKENPAIAAHVVDVLDTSSNHIVMSYVDTPIKKDKCLQNPLEVFVDYVKTLDAMYEASDTLSQAQGTETTTTPSLVFMDATFKNFGYEPDGGNPRLIDLGAFHVTGDDHMDFLRPSLAPPQMWSKNAQSSRGPSAPLDSEYTVEELRAVGSTPACTK